MDHSLRGYLGRRTTEELDMLLQSCLDGDSLLPGEQELRTEAVRIILQILKEREKDIPIKLTPRLKEVWQQYLDSVNDSV